MSDGSRQSQIKLTPRAIAPRASVRSRLQDACRRSCWRRASRSPWSSSTASSCGRSICPSPIPRPSRTTCSTGPRAYQRLWGWTFDSDPPSSWYTSITNMGIFGLLYIGICLALGLLLAILLDQKIRGEGVLRPIYLYPMALSFIVTGVAWKWFLDPGLGLEQTLHALGLDELPFRLDQEQGPRDLHGGDRRRLAGLRLRHGDVPGRPARHRRRDHEGGADRRRHRPASSTAASSSRCCGRSSCRPSSCSPTSPSSPTTSWWR